MLPEVWNYEELMRVKETQGDLFFMREYLLICIDEKKALFPYSLIRRCTDNSIQFLYQGEEGKNYVIGADIATSGSASADFTSFVVLEVRESKRDKESFISEKIVRHVFHEKGVPVNEQIDLLADLSHRFNNAPLLVEKNNVGVALIQDLVRRNINVNEFVTDKFKKESGIRFLINEMQNGRLWFPEETPEIKAMKEELRQYGIKEVRGRERMESLSGHDDLVDALFIANLATQNLAGGYSFAIVQD